MAADGDASLIVQSHAERLRDQKLQEQEKMDQEMAIAAANKGREFSSGVRIGFALAKAPVHLVKVHILSTYSPLTSIII